MMPATQTAEAVTYTFEQQRVIDYPREGGGTLLVRGPAGTGKSTALVGRLAALLKEGRRPSEILVLVPQRAWAERYERAVALLDAPTRGGVDIVTYYGLSRRDVTLFWPLVSRVAGFAHPDREPVFLTIETAQYHMWRIMQPLIAEKGYFSDLVIRRGRLLSQLIDNLNKAALVGFDHTTVGARLSRAWMGSPEQASRYVQAQDCANLFRAHCLANNLLDFSLVTEVYSRFLLAHEVYRRYFGLHYRHLLVDNLEENVPVAHDLIRWVVGDRANPGCDSTVMVLDEGGGYRLFLGADPSGAGKLAEGCSDLVEMRAPLECTHYPVALADALARALGVPQTGEHATGAVSAAVAGQFSGRYWISMVRWVAQECARLMAEGTPPEQIAIVAPYVSEVMRFAIEEELSAAGIQLRLLRPSTALRDDAIVRGLLTLVLLGHPHWEIDIPGAPSRAVGRHLLVQEDVALALQVALADLDPVRARRLAREALPVDGAQLADLSRRVADDAQSGPQTTRNATRLWDEVGYQTRERYQALRLWLERYTGEPPLPVDVFLSRLFGELLCAPGYAFHNEPDRARAYGRLVESATKFRQAVVDAPQSSAETDKIGRQFVELILGGVVSAEYVADRPMRVPPGVVLAPAYTYLTRDLRSRYQFWLDLGSDGWLNRPFQPLTHPYVLSRNWPTGKPWTDLDDEAAKRDTLVRVLKGLAARCSGGVMLGYSELGIGGEEQAGRLARAVLVALSRSV